MRLGLSHCATQSQVSTYSKAHIGFDRMFWIQGIQQVAMKMGGDNRSLLSFWRRCCTHSEMIQWRQGTNATRNKEKHANNNGKLHPPAFVLMVDSLCSCCRRKREIHGSVVQYSRTPYSVQTTDVKSKSVVLHFEVVTQNAKRRICFSSRRRR